MTIASWFYYNLKQEFFSVSDESIKNVTIANEREK